MTQTRRSSDRRFRQKSRGRKADVRSPRRRVCLLERLEERQMLAGNANPWHNIANPLDVNNDKAVGPMDALAVVNGLNWYGSGPLGGSLAALVHSGAGEGGSGTAATASSAIRDPKSMVDVDDDNFLTPIDALRVINALNEGEGPDLVRATVRMTTNVPARADRIPVLDYVPASPPAGYQSRQDLNTVTLGPTDTGNPSILLNVLVEDIRTNDGNFVDENDDGVDDNPDEFGVFAAYFDVTYDAGAFLIEPGTALNPNNDPTKNDPTFPISYINPRHQQFWGDTETDRYNYANGPSWDGTTPGLIDEVGGFTGYPSSVYGRAKPEVPQDKKFVFTNPHMFDVPLTVQSFQVGNGTYNVAEGQSTTLNDVERIGSATGESYAFGLNPAEDVGHDVLVYGGAEPVQNPDPQNPPSSVVPSDQIAFVNASVNVVNTRTLTVSVFQAPTMGTVTLGANNTFVYTPTVQGPATDTFVYDVTDGVTTEKGTVTISIGSVNDAPVITVPAAQTTNEDIDKTLAAGAISVADPDAGNGQLQVTVNVPNAATGSFSLGNPASGVTFTQGDGTRDTQMTFTGNLTQINNAFGAATFHPALNYNGPASVVITVNDQGNTGGTTPEPKSDTKALAINVTADNDAPVNTVPGDQTVPNNAAYVLSAANGNAISIADPDGNVNVQTDLSVDAGTLAVKPGGGATITTPSATSVRIAGTVAQVNDALSQVTYTAPVLPSPGFIDEVTLTVLTSDLGNTGSGNVLTDQDPIMLNVVPPRQPFAANDSATVAEDSENNPINVLDNDIPTENGTLTITLLNGQDVALQPIATTHGTVTTDGTTVSYTPADDYFGPDSFTYQITDSNGGEGPHTGTVAVSVTPVNDPPELTIPFTQVTTPEETQVLLANGGSISVADIDADASGGVRVTASVSQGTLNAPNGSVTITGANTGVLSITGLVAAVNASLAGLQYTPVKDYSGPDTLQVMVDDMGHTGGGSLTDSGSVALNVTPVNDAPTITAPTTDVVTMENTALEFLASGPNKIAVDDVDNGTLTVGLTVTQGTLDLKTTTGLTFNSGADNMAAMNFTGTLAQINAALDGMLYNPTQDYEGPATLSVAVTDGEKDAQQNVSIIVSGVNDPPQNNLPATATTPEDVALVFAGANLISITDVDAGTGNMQVSVTVTNGVFTLNPAANMTGVTVTGNGTAAVSMTGPLATINGGLNGSTYTPTANFNTADSGVQPTLTIITNDNGNTGTGGPQTDTDTLTIAVTPVNDPPVANDDGSPTDRTTILWNTADNELDVLANDNNGPDKAELPETKIISNVDTTNAHGTATVQNGKLYYTPANGYTGDAEIVYTLNDRADGTGLTDTATVYLTVVDYVPSDVSGHVYFDFDNDGKMDPEDLGIGGVRVTLTGWNIQGTYEERTAWTDETGEYTFEDVVPSQVGSKFTLAQQQPLGMVDGKDTPGEASVWKANDQFEIALPAFGFTDPTVAYDNNFAELGFRTEFASMGLYDLVHLGAGGQATGDEALVFGTDAAGNVQFYLNVGGWTNYVPGRQSANGYQVTTTNGKLPLTDTQAAAVREVNSTDKAIRSMYSPSGGGVTRILGSADDFGLPWYPTAAAAGGEGEGIDEISDAELLAASGSYEAAVDAVLAEVA